LSGGKDFSLLSGDYACKLLYSRAKIVIRTERTAMKTPTSRNATIQEIATRILGLETLETRNSDSLDFHELAVWTLQCALEEAYEAGARSKSASQHEGSK
jgi:hypothetical protein